MKSLSLNAFLNTIRNILNMVFPIITFPYVSRILGAHNLGIYNFSNTYVNYFLLLAALGINTYAIREGAKYRDNREEINKFVGQIFSINLVLQNQKKRVLSKISKRQNRCEAATQSYRVLELLQDSQLHLL